jgi:long-chain acyl-CoA synthetase
MEAVTAGGEARTGEATGSRTIADLLPLAARKFGAAPALRHKVGDEWKDISYSELGQTVKEVALGLIDLGLLPSEKVSILAHTRPEWTYACFGILSAGGTLVTIYQTNSPEECQYVLHHSDSRAVFVEDAEQLAKIREIEDTCPELQHVIIMDPGEGDIGDAITLDALRERGRGHEEAEWAERYDAVTPEDICLYIYTSGTTGPPKGCLLSHANYRAITDAVVDQSVLEEGDSTYLFLPLAHAFAILIQFASLDLGVTLAYWSRDPKMIIADIAQVSPSYFPSVPRMFEKIYTLATSNADDEEKLKQAVQLGVKVRMMREAGQEVPAELQ